jgi:two-component system sensor histidine kinase MprB
VQRVREVLALYVHKMRTSLQFRLVILAMATICLGTVASTMSTYQAARVSFFDELDVELIAIADQTAQQLGVDMTAAAIVSADSLRAENVVIMVVQANKNEMTMLGEPNNTLLISPSEIAIARVQTGSSARNGLRADGAQFRIVAVPFRAEGKPYALVLGRELAPTMASLSKLSALQWLIGLAIILLGSVTTYFLARAVFNPIARLTADVSEMTTTDELAPIEVHGGSEAAALERSFNALIGSLMTSRDRQNRLIADASHELRTPLTSLRTNIELLIADENAQMLPEGARRDILRDVAAQLGEFTSLVGDLVALSRDTVPAATLVPVDFEAIILRAVERAKRRGPGLNFAVNLQPMYVMGDSSLLERAMTNLLDNAVKFSPESGTVTVDLGENGLVITDEGPGISDADLPHIFERFYRSDISRNTPGTGLGLSIVAHTVASHSGSVEAGRAPSGGAQFVVRLPEVEPGED